MRLVFMSRIAGFGRVLLLGIGLIVGAALAEGALRLARPLDYPVHPPGMYLEDPEAGYVLTPGFEGEIARAEFRVTFSIGDDGLRGSGSRPRVENTFRVLVLGDSVAWGFGVEDHETYSVRLEERLNDSRPDLDIQVLNGGVPGYGTADELDFLRARGAHLTPDLVVVHFLSVNDLQENRVPARTWAAVRDGMLTTRSPDDPGFSLVRMQRWIKKQSYLARLLSDNLGYLGMRLGLLGRIDALWGEDFNEEDAERGIDLLVRIGALARELGARTLFLYTTGQAHVIQDNYRPLPTAAVIEEAAKRAGVTWIDATPFLRQREDRLKLYYPKDGHLTTEGHDAVAELLLQTLLRSDWLPRPDHTTSRPSSKSKTARGRPVAQALGDR